MAMRREDVILALGLDPGTFSQDLAKAVTDMRGFSGAVALGHQGSATAAGQSEKAHTGLLGKFREFRSEQVQQGRMARFYANELMSIVPAGDAVKGKLQEVLGIGIEGLAGGFGFGLAFEAAKFAISTVVELIEEAHVEEERVKKVTLEHAEAVQKVAQSWREYVRELQSDGLSPAAKKFQKEWSDANDKLKEAKNLVVDIEDELSAMGSKGHDGFFDMFKTENLKKNLKAAREEVAKNQSVVDQIDKQFKANNPVAIDKASEDLHRRALDMAVRYAGAEKRITETAEREKYELKKQYQYVLDSGNAEALKQYNAVRSSIEANAAEEIKRNREQVALRHATFMSQQTLLGATEEEKAAIEVANQKREIETQLAQARRAHDFEAVDRIKEELAAYTAASDVRLRAVASEASARRQVAADQAGERDAADSAQKFLEERRRMWVAQNLGVAGGDLDSAKRIDALKREYEVQKQLLAATAAENPELAPQIGFAQGQLKRKHDQDVLGASGLSDLYGGTQDYIQRQLDETQRMYAQIDAWRGDDASREAAAQQMKGQVAARENALKLQNTQQFFGTLASMQNSSVRELAAIGKAAAIAQATIDGILGVQKALAQGGFFGFAMAAAVGAAAAANVAQIASTFEVGGWTGGIAGRPAGIVHGEEFVVRAGPASRNRGLLEAMNAGASLSAAAVPAMPKIIIENHGTPQVYSDPQLTPEGVRLIARDEVHRESPRAVAAELQRDPNGHVSRALQRTTTVERRRL